MSLLRLWCFRVSWRGVVSWLRDFVACRPTDQDARPNVPGTRDRATKDESTTIATKVEIAKPRYFVSDRSHRTADRSLAPFSAGATVNMSLLPLSCFRVSWPGVVSWLGDFVACRPTDQDTRPSPGNHGPCHERRKHDHRHERRNRDPSAGAAVNMRLSPTAAHQSPPLPDPLSSREPHLQAEVQVPHVDCGRADSTYR